VSYVIVVVELGVLSFPAVSVNLLHPTDTAPELLCVFAVGVNTTVYEAPEPANDDRVPPLTVMSPTAKLVEASDNVNVNTEVSPDFNDDRLAVIELTEGRTVS
jgi:hypothetical protein